MRRTIFFCLLVASIAGATYLILFSMGQENLDHLKFVVETVRDGDWKWSKLDAETLFTYGLFAFLFVDGVLLLALGVMAITTMFRFERVYRFYVTSWWYLIASILMTGALIYRATSADIGFGEYISSMPWEYYWPLATALILVIFGLVFKRSENK